MGVVIVLIVIGFSGQDNFRAQNLHPPFNVNQVIEQVSHPQMTTGEFLIDTGITYMPAPGVQGSSQIAFDGSNYLVVWGDERYPGIYGTRVNKSGIILDTSGIAITAGKNCNLSSFTFNPDDKNNRYFSNKPSVVFDGTNYFVVWIGGNIYGKRISPAGKMIDSMAIPLSITDSWKRFPAVAFDGTNYLVVWEDDDHGGGSHIYGNMVSKSGFVLDSAGFAITKSYPADSQLLPAVAFDGENYLVVWEHNRASWWDIYGARISKSGAILDTSYLPISTDHGVWVGSSISIAFDGTNYLVVWDHGGDIYGTRVTPAGSVLDSMGFAISNAVGLQSCPSVTFGGSNYVVVWHDYRKEDLLWVWDIYSARVSTSGIVLDPTGVAIEREIFNQFFPAVAFDSDNYLVTWESNSDIYGAIINQSLKILDTLCVSITDTVNPQQSPSLTSDGANYFAVWQDGRNRKSYQDIYGIRIASSGVILDSSAIFFSTELSYDTAPAVASDSTNYFAVWLSQYISPEEFHILGTRLSQTGTILDHTKIDISPSANGQISPLVASDGINSFVVWVENGSVCYVRVSKSGAVLDTERIIISGGGSPAIAFGDPNYLIIWVTYDWYFWVYNIAGSLISPSGDILTSMGISLGSDFNPLPTIAFGGSDYFLIWQGYRNIEGALINKNSTSLDPIFFYIPLGDQYQMYPLYPSAAYDGSNFLVVWQDNRNDNWDIYGARVSPDGVVIDTFPVCVQPGDQVEPAIARGPNRQLLIVWSGWTPEINGKPANTMRIWGKFYPFTGIEESEDVRRKMEDVLTVTPSLFSKAVGIRFQGAVNEKTTLKIYDISGRCVKQFNHCGSERAEPFNQLTWDGKDDSRQNLPAGIYFCRLESESTKITKKVVKLK